MQPRAHISELMSSCLIKIRVKALYNSRDSVSQPIANQKYPITTLFVYFPMKILLMLRL
jgi:hypothetical protein